METILEIVAVDTATAIVNRLGHGHKSAASLPQDFLQKMRGRLFSLRQLVVENASSYKKNGVLW